MSFLLIKSLNQFVVNVLDEIQIQASPFSGNNEVYDEIYKVYVAGGKLAAVKLEFEIANTDATGQIEFSIGKDIKDTLGNTLIEDLVFKYNKQ